MLKSNERQAASALACAVPGVRDGKQVQRLDSSQRLKAPKLLAPTLGALAAYVKKQKRKTTHGVGVPCAKSAMVCWEQLASPPEMRAASHAQGQAPTPTPTLTPTPPIPTPLLGLLPADAKKHAGPSTQSTTAQVQQLMTNCHIDQERDKSYAASADPFRQGGPLSGASPTCTTCSIVDVSVPKTKKGGLLGVTMLEPPAMLPQTRKQACGKRRNKKPPNPQRQPLLPTPPRPVNRTL